MIFSLLPPPPALGVPASVVVLITVAYFVLVAPISGRRVYRRLLAVRDTDSTALTTFYRRTVTRKCAWVIPVVLVLLLVPGLRPEHLGLAWPHGPQLTLSVWMLVYAVALLAVSTMGLRWVIRSGRSVPGQRGIRAMIPRTRSERRWAWVGVTAAGVFEELLMRGLMFMAGLSVGLSPIAAVLVTSAMFGLLHLYQGLYGVLANTFVGILLSFFVLLPGSLLFAVVLHVLINVRALLVFPAADSSTPDSSTPDIVEDPVRPHRPAAIAGLVPPRPAAPSSVPANGGD